MLGKRKRVCSNAAPSLGDGEIETRCSKRRSTKLPGASHRSLCSLLTEENLNRLNETMSSPMSTPASAPSATTRSTTSSTNLPRAKRKLALYSIYTRRDKPMPPDLSELKAQILDGHRDRPPSPRARKITSLWRKTRDLTEEDAIFRLVDSLILGQEELLADDSASEFSLIEFSKNKDFAKDSVPRGAEATDPIYRQATLDAGNLSTPRPDLTYGYTARSSLGDGAFNRAEEDVLDILPLRDIVNLCGSLRFPFLTVQWKSLLYGGNHEQARIQGARDGSAAVYSLYRFLREAGVENPSASDTAHFSLTVDSDVAYIYLHWRNDESVAQDGQASCAWEMDEIVAAFLGQQSHMVSFRNVIRNIFDHALGRRLRMLKERIADFRQRKLSSGSSPSGKANLTPTQPTARAQVTPPPSQTSLSSEAATSPCVKRKRRRVQRLGRGYTDPEEELDVLHVRRKLPLSNF